VVIALLLLLLALPASAHAYVDPSAGSLLLQLILGGLAGLLVALRLSWKRITGLFGRGRAPGPAEERDQGQ
jgi:hypothetical protein